MSTDQSYHARTVQPMTAKSRPARPKDAASLVVYRRRSGSVEVLMGRRHGKARFKPGVYVFPGGIVERSDFRARPGSELDPSMAGDLAVAGSYRRATALGMAAIRETFEEVGIVIGQHGDVGPSANETWTRLRELRLAPALGRLHYLGRAITPSYNLLRYHARFFCVDERYGLGEVQSNGELEDLRWVALSNRPDLPFMNVTRMMLETLERRLSGIDEPPLFLSFQGGRRIIRRR
jgi:8-oxo-dGTP pyrophosphatase MutT (NUDIX family)